MKEKFSLSSIIEEEDDKHYKGEMKYSIPVDSNDKQTKRIKAIFKSLNCDFDAFRANSNINSSFELPVEVAEVCRGYISEDSSKGGAISNIRIGNLSNVKPEDKMKLLHIMEANLKEKVDYNIDEYFTILRHEIEDSEKVKNMIKRTQSSIETTFLEFSGIDGTEGLVSVINTDKMISESNNGMDSFKEETYPTKMTSKMKLNNMDKLVLMEYLETFLEEKIKEWLKIVDIAGEIRESDLVDYAFENIDMLTSEELLEEAIKEFENEKNLERESIKVHTEEGIHTPEEFKEILDEIKKNIKK